MPRKINHADYMKLLELDKKVYPTSSPVTAEVVASWYQNNPEFGIMLDEGGYDAMCICIPLNKKGWQGLISGKLLEKDMNGEYIFNNKRDKELGIHIYHLEKFNDKKKTYLKSLEEISKVVEKLRKTNKDLEVIGFSGLAVTSAGINLLYNMFNCRERDFLNSEYILKGKANNKLEAFDTKSKKELSDKLKQGYEFVTRCKMLVLYPNEPSIVWDYIKIN